MNFSTTVDHTFDVSVFTENSLMIKYKNEVRRNDTIEIIEVGMK